MSRSPVILVAKWEPLLVCLLIELKEKYRTSLVALCTIPLNPDYGSPIADFMNGNVTRWNAMVRKLIAENSNKLRLMDIESALRMVDHSALRRDRIPVNNKQGRQLINEAFQTKIEVMEAELQTMVNPRHEVAMWQREVSCASTTSESSRTYGDGSQCCAAHSQLGREREIGDRHRSQKPIFGEPTRRCPLQVAPQLTTSTAGQSARVPMTQRNSQADSAGIINTDKVSCFGTDQTPARGNETRRIWQ